MNQIIYIYIKLKIVMLPRFSRRDKSYFTRNTYTKIINMILDKCTLDEALNVLVAEVQSLLNGQVPLDDLIINKTLSTYKTDTYYMKLFADKLKNNGKIINPGDTVSFIVVKSSSNLLVDKMRLVENNVEPIDYDYYIEKELMGPINQLFKVGFETEMTEKQRLCYNANEKNRLIVCV